MLDNYLKEPFYYGKPDWLVVVIERIPVYTILLRNPVH